MENKRPPSSIHELVGSTAYIRRVTPIDGEDYTTLSMQRNGALAIMTVSGVSVTYDPDGGTTTNIDMPPEVARARELRGKIEDTRQAALAAYRLANKGNDPRNEKALLPFFATPEEGADFVEYLESEQKARRY